MEKYILRTLQSMVQVFYSFAAIMFNTHLNKYMQLYVIRMDWVGRRILLIFIQV